MGIPFYEMVFIYRNISSDYASPLTPLHTSSTHAIGESMSDLENNKSSTYAFVLYLDNDSSDLAYVFFINFCILYADRWMRENHFVNLYSHWSDCFLDTACKTSPGNFN